MKARDFVKRRNRDNMSGDEGVSKINK